MTAKPRLAKAIALLGGATLLAAAVGAQVNQNSLGNSDDTRAMTLQFQTSMLGGGSTGGGGGVITGPTPRRLSRVVVTTPAPSPGP